MLAQLPTPAIIAHRGSSAYAPENTLAAFRLAVSHGADGLELDAKLSADGVVMVIHDATLERTTNGSGAVAAHTLAQLKTLDAGSFFDPEFRTEHIPTLDEVFETVGGKIMINVELTNYASRGDELPEKTAAMIYMYGLSESVYCSSFNPLALRRIHRLLPQVPLGLLALPGRMGWAARTWLGRMVHHETLNPEHNDVTQALVSKALRRGEKLFPYTVNSAQEMTRLFNLGAAGIFTDDPPLAQKTRDTFWAQTTQ